MIRLVTILVTATLVVLIAYRGERDRGEAPAPAGSAPREHWMGGVRKRVAGLAEELGRTVDDMAGSASGDLAELPTEVAAAPLSRREFLPAMPDASGDPPVPRPRDPAEDAHESGADALPEPRRELDAAQADRVRGRLDRVMSLTARRSR